MLQPGSPGTRRCLRASPAPTPHHGHMWRRAPCSCIPRINTRGLFAVRFLVNSVTRTRTPHHPVLPTHAEAGLCQYCAVPALGTAKDCEAAAGAACCPRGAEGVTGLAQAPPGPWSLPGGCRVLWPRAGARSGEEIGSSHPRAAGFQSDVLRVIFTRGRCCALVCTEELVVLTHILVPLSNPHINMYFCYYFDGLFILSLCTEGATYPLQSGPKTCAQKPWQDQRPLRASAATDVVVSQETEKGIKIPRQEADPEETPQCQRGTGTPGPAAWVLPQASALRVGSHSGSVRGACQGRG